MTRLARASDTASNSSSLSKGELGCAKCPRSPSTPPAATKAELTRLRRQLTRDVPRKTDRNLLVATWNIREFGGLTDKWRSTASDSPKRDLHSLALTWDAREACPELCPELRRTERDWGQHRGAGIA
jgi:hypothetical protein